MEKGKVFEQGDYPHRDLTERVIKCAIAVHSELGPGLLESIYEEAMTIELKREGLKFQRQVELPIAYKGEPISGSYRLDMIIENSVVVELKATAEHSPIFDAQLLTYMKLGAWKTGLLLNFNRTLLRDGIKRLVL